MKNINKIISLSLATVLLANPFNAFALTKTETIYSTLGYNGNVKKTVINTKLSDISKGDVVDYTNLSDIKNINGREKFNLDNDKLTWKSTGKDIFYQGKIDSELPVKVDVKYYLDGKELKPKDIKGKSGKVKMVFNFTNESYDSKSHMYTPFVVSTSTIINGDDNSNVEISTGKVVNTGNKNIVTGISAPGLYDSTGIKEFDSLDSLTITYDTKKFSTSEVYFVISPKLLDQVDLDTLNKVDSLNSSLILLQDSTNKLESGANELRDGANTLNNGASTLNDGAKSALDGSKKLDDGTTTLNAGLKRALDGAKALSDGTGSVDDNLQTIITGLKNQEKELVNQQNSDETKAELASVQYLLTQNKNTLTALTNGNAKIEAGVKAAGLDVTVSADQFNATVDGAKAAGMIDDATANQLKAYKTSYDNNASLIQLVSGNIQGLNTMLDKLNTTSTTVSESLKTLDGYLTQLQSEGTTLTKSGAKTIYDGLTQLYAGSNTLSYGTKSLTSGLTQLYAGTQELSNGTKSLSDGSNTLASGISQLNSQGINELSSIGNKAVDYKNKIATLTRLSKDYKGFASDNADTTIFVYKIAK